MFFGTDRPLEESVTLRAVGHDPVAANIVAAEVHRAEAENRLFEGTVEASVVARGLDGAMLGVRCEQQRQVAWATRM